jgi:hypothetical protein
MKPINSPQSRHDVLIREFRPASIVMSSVKNQVANAQDALQRSLICDHGNAPNFPRPHDFERSVNVICGLTSRDVSGHRLLGYKLGRSPVSRADRNADIAVGNDTHHFSARIDHG